MSRVWIMLSGTFGAFIVALADLVQKGEASSVLAISNTLQVALSLAVPPIFCLALVIAIGLGLCLVFQPETQTKAFNRGASVLAIIMTMVPISTPPSPTTEPAAQDNIAPSTPQRGQLPAGLFNVAHAFSQTRKSQRQRDLAEVRVNLTTSDDKQVPHFTLTILELRGFKILARSKVPGSKFTFYETAGIYTLRVESEGYSIVQSQIALESNRTTIVDVHLQATSMSLFLQRLFPTSEGNFNISKYENLGKRSHCLRTDGIEFVVDDYNLRQGTSSEYKILLIGIYNRSGKDLRFDRESFILLKPDGTPYSLAGPNEPGGTGRQRRFLLEMRPTLFTWNVQRVSSNFFPNSTNETVILPTLPTNRALWDFLAFKAGGEAQLGDWSLEVTALHEGGKWTIPIPDN